MKRPLLLVSSSLEPTGSPSREKPPEQMSQTSVTSTKTRSLSANPEKGAEGRRRCRIAVECDLNPRKSGRKSPRNPSTRSPPRSQRRARRPPLHTRRHARNRWKRGRGMSIAPKSLLKRALSSRSWRNLAVGGLGNGGEAGRAARPRARWHFPPLHTRHRHPIAE